METTVFEKELADQLKNLCYINGREKIPPESAKVFHKLGLEFQKRSPDKVSLIQSAALFNAAIIRKPDNVRDIMADLRKLCSLVLMLAEAENQGSRLVSIAGILKYEVENMRKSANKALDNLDFIPKEAKGDELVKLERRKISDVMNIQNEISSSYSAIMKNLAVQCKNIMGDPPSGCKFALVGMGSLARKEITPYSDFENIIVLEEGAQTKDNYEKILEYFRWFAVIFQLVLVNMGETILPSVAIPCMNDFTNPEGDWFFDAFTPSGICFDGMMPHACKSPLGRQELTKNKPWKTELIQPVSKMSQYLDSTEDLKNGYHLSDILTKTCFVAGDQSVYDAFKKCVEEKLEHNRKNNPTFLKGLEKQVFDDKVKFDVVDNCYSMYLTGQFNMKRVVYRSTTIFLSALATFHGMDSSSCFDTIRQLAGRGLITSEDEHKLNYAVAVACEVRLKIYMKRKSQNDFIDNKSTVEDDSKEVIRAVGERSIVDCFAIATAVQGAISELSPAKVNKPMNMRLDVATDSGHVALICFCLNLYEMCINFCKSSLENDKQMRKFEKSKYLDYIGSSLRHLGKLEESIEYTEMSLDIQRKIPDEVTPTDLANLLCKIALAKESMNKQSESLQCYEEALKLQRSTPSNDSADGFVAYCLSCIGRCLMNLERYDESLSKFKEEYVIRRNRTSDESRDVNIAQNIACYGVCLKRMDKNEEALHEFEKELTIRKKISADENNDYDVARSMCNKGLCLRKIGKIEEALATHRQELIIRRRVAKDQSADKDLSNCLEHIGYCLMELKRYDEALLELEEVLKILKRTNGVTSEVRHQISVCHRNIGFYLLNSYKYKEALQEFKIELVIRKKISADEDNCRDVATSMWHNSLYLRKIGKIEEALATHRQELVIRRRVAKDQSVDKDLSNCLQRMGEFLIDLKRYGEALPEFEEVLKILNRTYGDTSEVRHHIRVCHMNIGLYLLRIHKYKEALQEFEKELAILRNMSADENNDCYVANNMEQRSLCLRKIGKIEEALATHRQELVIRRRVAKDQSVDKDLSNCLQQIGKLLIDLERYGEALPEFEEVLKILKRTNGYKSEVRHQISVCHMNIGISLLNSYKYKEALQEFEKVLTIRKNISADEVTDYDVATSMWAKGLCLRGIGKIEEALVTHRQELVIIRRMAKDQSVDEDLSDCLQLIGCCLMELERYDEALPELEEVMKIRKRINGVTSEVRHRISVCLMNKEKK